MNAIDLDSVDWMFLVSGAVLGLVWTPIAILSAFSGSVTLDPAGMLRAFLLLPLVVTYGIGSVLSAAGFSMGSDILPFALICGLVEGLLGGSVLLLLNRRYCWI